MRRFLIILAMIMVIGAVIFSGCPKPAPPEEAPPTPPAPPAPEIPEEILIGDVVSYTGGYATFGINAFGVKAAFEDINKLGGIYVEEYGTKLPVKWITRDSLSDALKVAPLAEDLILRDKVHFLGPHDETPPMRQGVCMMAEKYKIASVIGTGPFETHEAMEEAAGGWKYSWMYGLAIGTPPNPPHYQADDKGILMIPTMLGGMSEYVAQTNMKVAIFASDDTDGKSWYAGFGSLLVEEGYDCYGVDREFGVFPMGTTDFAPIINEWKTAGCEILWGNCPATDYGILWKQCHTLGFQPKMVVATRAGGYYNDVQAWGGDLPQAVIMECFWNPQVQGVGIGGTTPESLFQRFYEETGQPLAQGIGYEYMGAQILFDAIERAGTLEAEAVLEALSATDLMTMDGRVVFEKETQFFRWPVAMGQWQKTDNPWVWEAPTVFSYSDRLPATAELIFPVPYD